MRTADWRRRGPERRHNRAESDLNPLENAVQIADLRCVFVLPRRRGSAGLCTTTVQVYYPDTNTTAVLAADPFAGTVNGATVFPGGVVSVGNKGYAWGGFCGGTTSPYTGSQTWIFDPAAVGSNPDHTAG